MISKIAVILPLVSFFLTFRIVQCILILFNKDFSLRYSFLLAAIFWGLLLTLITELLSIFSLINFGWLLGIWGGVNFVEFFIYRAFARRKLIRKIIFKAPPILGTKILLLFGIVFIVMTLGLIALVAPPNNWDSMTYHMSRVSHWIQDKNVGFYPTSILKQLYYAPWAEFAIMHFQVLSRGDHFANLIQWMSMIGCLIGVSLLAKNLGANSHRQVFACVVVATIPMGILQATSTQNDYVVSFWLVCFVFFVMQSIKQPANSLYAIVTGISLGLALLTKATSYLYSFPFLLWYLLINLKNINLKTVRSFAIIGVFIVVINGGHYMRNYDMFKHPLGTQEAIKLQRNDTFNFPILFSNIIRNIGLHCGTPSPFVNKIFYKGIKSVHKVFNQEINNTRSSYPGKTFSIPFSYHEDFAGNFLYLILASIASLIFLFSKSQKQNKDLAYYVMALTSAFVLFCLLLKWQPWGSRLNLPLFVLGAPFIAQVLPEKSTDKFKKVCAMILLILIVFVVSSCLLYLCFGYSILEKIYKSEALSFLNKFIEGRANYTLAYYVEKANREFIWLQITLAILILITVFLLKTHRVLTLISCILIICSFPWLFFNSSRNIVGSRNIFNTTRTDQYFASRQEVKNPYERAVDFLKYRNCTNIGLMLGDDDYEYPLHVLLKENLKQKTAIRLEHVDVKNPSSIKFNIYPFKGFRPCAIITTKNLQDEQVIYQGSVYVKEFVESPIEIYINKKIGDEVL